MKRNFAAIMMAMLCIWALLPASAMAQTGCKPPEGIKLVTPGVLTVTTNPTSPPLQYIDEQGNIVGMDIDLGRMIAAKLCLPIKYIASEFATMIPSLKDGRYDMIDTFMYYTPERAQQITMIPYGAATVSIVMQAGTTGGKTLAEFSRKRLATQLGSVDDVNARKVDMDLRAAGKPGIDIHTFPNYSDLLQALSGGQVDGAIISTDGAFYYRSKGMTFFRIAATGLYPHLETIGFADPVLAEKAAAALDALKMDGSYDKLLSKFHHCALPGPFKVSHGPLPDPVCPQQAE
ncbi:MAG: transporter substrate-binding domain-containing protein [Acetobacteraceae bacterium]